MSHPLPTWAPRRSSVPLRTMVYSPTFTSCCISASASTMVLAPMSALAWIFASRWIFEVGCGGMMVGV